MIVNLGMVQACWRGWGVWKWCYSSRKRGSEGRGSSQDLFLFLC